MKKKTIWSLVLALALVVTAIGTATSAFAATSAPMEPVTKIATENEDAIWEQIEAIDCHTAAFVANPDQYSVANQVDVQFSGPIAMALEAFGYKPGPAWQDKIALNDPRLLAFAKKVTMHVAPEYAELRRKDPLSWYGRVEVTVGGQVYTESVDYSRGTNKDGYRLTDEEIQDRFRLGANCILPDYKAEKVIAETAQLENAANLTALFENLCL